MPTANCDQRMSATGYEETELTYNVNEEEQQKVITTHLILFYIDRSQNKSRGSFTTSKKQFEAVFEKNSRPN